jgi:hypothetical protein
VTPRIFIAIACRNRRRIAEQCLPTMRDSAEWNHDCIALYDDGSSEYEAEWLRQFTGPSGVAVIGTEQIGIQAQRRLHLSHFLGAPEAFTHLYFSDHDVLMDPTWRENALRIQQAHNNAPLCLYNTQAHARLAGNTIDDDPASEVIWRRVAPGVSYLLTREHVERLAPHIGSLQHFDWQIPALLGGRFAVTRTSYCDHIGHGGERHPAHEGLDGGDRATNPTPWLVAKRAEVVARLSQTP